MASFFRWFIRLMLIANCCMGCMESIYNRFGEFPIAGWTITLAVVIIVVIFLVKLVVKIVNALKHKGYLPTEKILVMIIPTILATFLLRSTILDIDCYIKYKNNNYISIEGEYYLDSIYESRSGTKYYNFVVGEVSFKHISSPINKSLENIADGLDVKINIVIYDKHITEHEHEYNYTELEWNGYCIVEIYVIG